MFLPCLKYNLAGGGTRPVYTNNLGLLLANYTPSPITTTSYNSVPAAEFRRWNGGSVIFSNGEISGANNSTDTLIAPVNLPQNAILKSLMFCFKDAAPNTHIMADLMSAEVISPNKTVIKMASLATSNIVIGNNFGCVTTTAFVTGNIANNVKSYWIRAYPKKSNPQDPNQENDQWQVGGLLKIIHFIFEYDLIN